MYKVDIGEFDGDTWEAIIQKCLKDKYEDEYYQRMPANTNGDSGIEGLTLKTGKVFQCYCPDAQYETSELTKKLQIKINGDLNKLVKYKDDLIKVLGSQKIKQWYLITPEYKDKSLVAYCRKKEEEYRRKNLEHLDPEFTVLIKEYTDFHTELIRHMKLMEFKIDISVDEPKDSDWKKCNSEHIENLIRKVTVLINEQQKTKEQKEESIKKIVDSFVSFYNRGLKVLQKLEDSYVQHYQKFNRIKLSQGEKIEQECLMNILPKNELYRKIEKELEDALFEGLGEDFEKAGLQQLSRRIIAEWLMVCPLNFGE